MVKLTETVSSDNSDNQNTWQTEKAPSLGRRVVAAGAAAVMSLSLLAGCGGEGNKNSEPTPEASTSESTPDASSSESPEETQTAPESEYTPQRITDTDFGVSFTSTATNLLRVDNDTMRTNQYTTDESNPEKNVVISLQYDGVNGISDKQIATDRYLGRNDSSQIVGDNYEYDYILDEQGDLYAETSTSKVNGSKTYYIYLNKPDGRVLEFWIGAQSSDLADSEYNNLNIQFTE